MKKYKNIKSLMKKDLIKADKMLINSLACDIEIINNMSWHIINSGGKRLRPLLLMLCARATNYKGEKHHSMAVVIELIHTATLLHDDVVDESTSRRGKKTANQIWGPAPSVLVGDFLYSRAFQIMLDSDSMKIIKLLSETTNNIAQGEVMQLINIKNANISQKEYFNVIERKTACLFKAACEIGAILSGSNKIITKSLGNFGLHLGNAFQIIDDVLDYESNIKTTGKDFGKDLAEGKTTLPIIYALEKSSKSEYRILKNAIENADISRISDVIEILLKTNAFAFARKVAKKESEKAMHSLKLLPDSEYLSAMKDLCDLSLRRKY